MLLLREEGERAMVGSRSSLGTYPTTPGRNTIGTKSTTPGRNIIGTYLTSPGRNTIAPTQLLQVRTQLAVVIVFELVPTGHLVIYLR